MQITLEQYRALSNAIFSAALDRSQWTAVLDCAADLVPGARLHLFGYDLEGVEPFVSCTRGYDPHWVERFENYYAAMNPWAKGFLDQPVGRVLSAEGMCPAAEVRRTEFYADWIRPQDDILRGGGGVIGRSDGLIGLIGANIEARRGGDAERDWLELVELMMPLLRRTWETGLELSSVALERDLLELGGVAAPAILLISQEGRLRFANARGKRELESGEVVGRTCRGRLCFRDPRAQEACAQLRAELGRGAGDLQMALRAGGGSVRLRMIPFDPEHLQDWGLGVYLGLDRPSLALILSRGDPRAPGRQARLAALGLTPSEAEVAVLLAEGLAPREIAGQRGTTYNTARNQIKAIAEKLGVRRQAEIVQVIGRTL